MRGNTRPDAFGAVETGTGQREELPQAPAQPRQVPAAAHVGEQADTAFGHGEARVLGRDAIFARQRDADAAAHGDAVHEGDDRLAVFEHLVVEPIFIVEESAAAFPVIVQCRVAQQVDIAARAEAAALCMIEDHRLDRLLGVPFGQRCAHRVAHVERERVERLGPVERDMAGAGVDVRVELFSHCASRIRSDPNDCQRDR